MTYSALSKVESSPRLSNRPVSPLDATSLFSKSWPRSRCDLLWEVVSAFSSVTTVSPRDHLHRNPPTYHTASSSQWQSCATRLYLLSDTVVSIVAPVPVSVEAKLSFVERGRRWAHSLFPSKALGIPYQDTMKTSVRMLKTSGGL